jgi:hypothetical protein
MVGIGDVDCANAAELKRRATGIATTESAFLTADFLL